MVADEADAHAVAVQRLDLAAEGAHEQFHQQAHFQRRPLPVFLAEGEQGQHLDAETVAGADDAPRRADAGAVAERPRAMALPRPAAVAVHDDGDVPRQARLGYRRGFAGHGLGRAGIRPRAVLFPCPT